MKDIDRTLDLLRAANPVSTLDDLDGAELAASVATCARAIEEATRTEADRVTVVAAPVPHASATRLPSVRPLLVPAAVFAVAVMAIAMITFGTALLEPSDDPGVPAAPPTSITQPDASPSPTDPDGAPFELAIDRDLVYWTDGTLDYTVDVYHPIDRVGPWPVVVVYPYNAAGVTHGTTARAMAERGAVVFAPVSVLGRDLTSPDAYIDGGLFDRAACAVGFAQANADAYGGDPARTTLIGSAGGEHHATWAALGLVREDVCDDPILHAPTGLIVGMPQWLFQVDYWDDTIGDAGSNAVDTLDRFWNPDRWAPADELTVHIWVTASRSNIRSVSTSPADEAWLSERDTTGTLIRDLEVVAAFDDGEIRYDDNARAMYLRMRGAGLSVTLDQMATEGYSVESTQYERMWEIIAGG